MGSNTAFIYGDINSGLIKVIADPASVRLKLCPLREDATTDSDRYDEVIQAVSANLDRQAVNRLIRDLKKMRNRVFGADE